MSIVNVVKVSSFEELVPHMSTCSSMVICNDDSLIAELRSTFGSLYIKQYSDIRAGQFPNATYILRVEDNTDVNELRNSLGANAILYALPIEKVETEEEEEIGNEVNEESFSETVRQGAGSESESCKTEESGTEETENKDSGSIGETSDFIEKDVEGLETGENMSEEEPSQELLVNLEEMLTKDYSMLGEGIIFDQANFDPTPVKPYDDQDFASMSAMFAVLTRDMDIVASKDIIAKLAKERPDIRAREIHKGGIATTGGMVVLLSANSNLYKREARRIYPSDATLFTVSK